MPQIQGGMQTLIVVIAARSAVEEFLGKLEGEGYLADRLELPILDQIQATKINGDGAWIYPSAGGVDTALVAWWYGGVLRNLDLLTVSPGNRGESLREQLMQMAWAGELEGWLTSPPAWRIVAEGTSAAEWEPIVRSGMDEPVEVLAPVSVPQLAELTASRSAHADPAVNLLPAEYSTRYHQQFVDGLWMRALGVVVGLYVVGVAIYLVALQVVLFQTRSVEKQVQDLGPNYTNALQFKAQFQVLKDRQDLKFAGLDCWKAVAETLPENVTLDSFNFTDGHRLTLNGTAPPDYGQQLIKFDDTLRKSMPDGLPLFDRFKGDFINSHLMGSTISWALSAELKRADVQ